MATVPQSIPQPSRFGPRLSGAGSADGSILLEELGDHLAAVTRNLRDESFKPALTKCNEQIEQGIQDNFINSRTAQGTPWAPRKQSRQILSLKQGPSYELSNPPLILSSRLMQSATNSESPDAVVEIHDRGLTRGTDVEYAHFHSEGTKKMPQREFMDVPESYLAECDEIIADFGLEVILSTP